MSIDIFSLRAIENISVSVAEWRRKLLHGVEQVDPSLKDDLPDHGAFRIKFLAT
jgi:hypothetical protein